MRTGEEDGACVWVARDSLTVLPFVSRDAVLLALQEGCAESAGPFGRVP